MNEGKQDVETSCELPEPAGKTSLHLREAMAGDFALPEGTVERLSRPLYALLRRRSTGGGVDANEAEDLIHEVWCRVIPKIPHLKPRDGRITPVVARYMQATLTNLLAKRALRVRHESLDASRTDGSGFELNQFTVEEEGPGVISRIASTELRGKISCAIADLVPLSRKIVLARALSDCTNAEIAAMLEMTEAAVKKRMERARRELSEKLQIDELK